MRKATNKLEVESILNACHLKKTRPRVRVLTVLAAKDMAVPGPVLAKKMKDLNRATLYSVIHTLEAKGVIYKAFGVNGTVHYAMCRSKFNGSDTILYTNFNCIQCRKIYCLNEAACSLLSLPEGFNADRFVLCIAGICPLCNKKRLSLHKS
jgi:Fur family ferric uptake transcriptional regulator